jgi:hypothetical protein
MDIWKTTKAVVPIAAVTAVAVWLVSTFASGVFDAYAQKHAWYDAVLTLLSGQLGYWIFGAVVGFAAGAWLDSIFGPTHKWRGTKELKLIRNRRFANEQVPVDGYKYFECTFQNCTLNYNGTTRPDISHCTFEGSMGFSSSNEGIEAAWLLLHALGATRDENKIIGLDRAHNNFERVKFPDNRPSG